MTSYDPVARRLLEPTGHVVNMVYDTSGRGPEAGTSGWPAAPDPASPLAGVRSTFSYNPGPLHQPAEPASIPVYPAMTYNREEN